MNALFRICNTSACRSLAGLSSVSRICYPAAWSSGMIATRKIQTSPRWWNAEKPLTDKTVKPPATAQSCSSRCGCCRKVAIGLAVAAVGYAIYKFFLKRPRKSPLKKDFKEGVVYLYQFNRTRGIPNLSPFCLKLETWLRMAKIPYETPKTSFGTWSSEGTLPFVEYNGKEYPDSSFAIRDLTTIFNKESMDAHLTAEQRAIARSFEELAEYSLVVTIVFYRWSKNLDGFLGSFARDMFGKLTPVMLPAMKTCGARGVMKSLKASYVGKHSDAEILNIAHEDLRAISTYLGSKKFFFGNKPSKIDAVLFGVLAQIVYSPFDIPQKEFIANDFVNLKHYCDRMKELYWPDWDEVTNIRR